MKHPLKNKLTISEMIEFSENKDKRLTIWKDFVSIHCNLIEKDLKASLSKYSKIFGNDITPKKSQKNVEFLMNQFIIERNKCCFLPLKSKLIINYLTYQSNNGINGTKNIRPNETPFDNVLLTYYVIHCGMASLLHGMGQQDLDYLLWKFCNWRARASTSSGFTYTHKHLMFYYFGYNYWDKIKPENKTTKTKTNTNVNTNEKKEEKEKEQKKECYTLDGMKKVLGDGNLVDFCFGFILCSLAQCGIFGNYLKFTRRAQDVSPTAAGGHYFTLPNYDVMDKFLIQWLFNGNLDQFKKLIEYCCEDLRERNNVRNMIDIYKDNVKQLRSHFGSNTQYGIMHFVIARLSYVVFHDLMAYHNNEQNLYFPKLQKFFQFCYNYSVFIHLTPRNYVKWINNDDIGTMEPIFLRQYYLLENTLFKNIFGDNINSNYNGDTPVPEAKLTTFISMGGTIVHSAVRCKMAHYCEFLFKHGQAHHCYTEAYGVDTPASHAKTYRLALIESLINKYTPATDADNDSKEQEDSESVKADSKSIELKYHSFLSQLMFAKYYLMTLGYSVPDQWSTESDLYCSYQDFKGLINYNNNGIQNDKNTKTGNMMDLVYVMIGLLQKKMLVSQDILVLCYVYCTLDGNGKLFNQFVDCLNNVVNECLGSNNDNVNELCKTRNYIWFKEYLLHNNIWLVKYGDDKNNTILFDNLVGIINKELVEQKKYIWDQFKQEEKNNNDEFSNLLSFGNSFKNVDSNALRQDRIKNGIVSFSNEIDLLCVAATQQNSSHFDVIFENNTKTYLTQLLSFAHENNNRFQKEMSRVFADKEKYANSIYQAAPVKLYDRCVVKATSDYANNGYPSAAHILDILRFSVTFKDIKSMLQGLNTFINAINNGEISCLTKVQRIKNGFANVGQWKSLNEASYVDIKLNIIYQNEQETQSMIIEAQFLLSFLLKAKKMGHKYYSIVRQTDYINAISDEMYNVDGDSGLYNDKIRKLIESNSTNNMIKQLFLQPNKVLSLKKRTPLLCKIGEHNNDKLYLLFLNFIFHFSSEILSDNDDTKEEYMGKYLNYENCNHTLTEYEFFGIEQRLIKSFDSMKYKNMELIMKQKCFNGLSNQTGYVKIHWFERVLFDNGYFLLHLTCEYFDKNFEMYKAGIKNYNKGSGNQGLISRCLHGSYNWMRDYERIPEITDENNCLSLYLRITEKCDMLETGKNLQNAIQICTKQETQDENSKNSIFWDYAPAFRKLIQDYIKRNNIQLPPKKHRWY